LEHHGSILLDDRIVDPHGGFDLAEDV